MTTSRLRLYILATLAIFMVAACGSISSTNPTNNPQSPAQYTMFLQHVSHARYTDYAQLPTTKVQSEQAFEEMRSYILQLYNGIKVTGTYTVNGRYFDCIIRLSTPAPLPIPREAVISNYILEQSNASAPTSCQDGSTPMERITLEQLVQFPTLQDFLAKNPGGPSIPPASPTGTNFG